MINFLNSLFSVVGGRYMLGFVLSIVKLPTAILLILVNLIPIIGVIYLRWNPFDVILAYWLENVVVGFFTFLRILKAEGKSDVRSNVKLNGRDINTFANAGLAQFFVVHFGMFTLIHGMFVFTLFGQETNIFRLFGLFSFLGFMAGITFSHGISYYANFIKGKEYLHNSPQSYFLKPYPRIIAIHMTIILGGVFASESELSNTIIIIFVGLKIIIDLVGHVYSHRQKIKEFGINE